MKQPGERLTWITSKTPDQKGNADAVIEAGIWLMDSLEQREGRIFSSTIHADILQSAHLWRVHRFGDEIRDGWIVGIPKAHVEDLVQNL